jgi:hypothetical protein
VRKHGGEPYVASETSRDMFGSISSSTSGLLYAVQDLRVAMPLTQRKPIFEVELSGVFAVLAATRYRLQYEAWQRNDPPFITFACPVDGPVGSCASD